MLNNNLLTHISSLLADDIISTFAVGGGSINAVYCLQSAQNKYLLKVNDQHRYPLMFAKEAVGLNVIAATQTIKTPKVLAQGDFEATSFLLLEWIDTQSATAAGSALLGKQLAQMHRVTADGFGVDADNYMGSLPQSNRKHKTWADFYINERLKPMVKLAIDKGLLSRQTGSDFDRLYKKLPKLFAEEQPALIHGDLWSGNYLIDTDDTPYLIDPAVTYGHREFDIAMTTLFGGFDDEFYTTYNESYPLAKGWEGRIDLWNLYPLLIHLNLFGSDYLEQVEDNLAQYVY